MRRIAFVLAATGLVALLVILGLGASRGVTNASNPAGLQAKLAPDFVLPSVVDGQPISLSSFRGKPVVLNFWASWCASCREEAPLLSKTYRDYRDQGVVFLGVNVSDSPDGAQGFIKEFSISYANVRDYTGAVTTNYRVTGLPTTFFISRDGRILSSYVGPISQKRLMASISQIVR